MKTKIKIPKSLQNVELSYILRRSGIHTKLAENQRIKEAVKPIAQNMNNKPVVAKEISKSFTNDQITEYVNKRVHTIEIVEEKLQNKLDQYIQFIKNGFLKNLDAEISKKNFAKFLQKDYFSDNEEEFLSKAQIDFTPLLDNLASIAGNDANKLIGITDPYFVGSYRKKIEKNVNKFTKSMLDTDRDHLINLITNGLQEGKTNVEIRNAIEADFSEYSTNQAKRITTTEVARVSQQAAIDAYQESGVVEELQWITYGADDECADYDGETRSIDDSGFYSSDNEFQDGDPPLHPNCKCQLIPIVTGTEPTYEPDNKTLRLRIEELESQADKRTKEFKDLKKQTTDDEIYVKALEKFLGVNDE